MSYHIQDLLRRRKRYYPSPEQTQSHRYEVISRQQIEIGEYRE